MHTLGWPDFLLILLACSFCMFLCRVLPLFMLKNKELPHALHQALSFIPPAAFGALVANDLFDPHMFDAGLWPASIPLIAALGVALVGYKTKSLLWCGIAGVTLYFLLSLI